MTEYIVIIEETLVQEFKIVAESAEDALKQAEKKYRKEEIVLDNGEVQYKQMSAILPGCEIEEWYEF